MIHHLMVMGTLTMCKLLSTLVASSNSLICLYTCKCRTFCYLMNASDATSHNCLVKSPLSDHYHVRPPGELDSCKGVSDSGMDRSRSRVPSALLFFRINTSLSSDFFTATELITFPIRPLIKVCTFRSIVLSAPLTFCLFKLLLVSSYCCVSIMLRSF
jgi:hypothetical protein